MAKIDAFFQLMHDQGASDLHLVSGQQPVLRIRGEMERVKFNVLNNDELKAILYEIAPEHKVKQFEETGDVDFAYEIPNLARYRANFFSQKFGVAAVFREIPSRILTCQDLGLPAVLSKLATLPRGLVLVTGPTGCGKSTTLAAIIDEANRMRKDHIITIEDPIEFVHHSEGYIINHREVGLHTKSFSAALRGALREDPDIILVGEMRDLETISLAVEAANTGHLVFSTLHTNSAAQTIGRIIDSFTAEQQNQIRVQLSTSLLGIFSQRLVPRISGGLIPACELLINNDAVGNLIRENRVHEIDTVIETGSAQGMIDLNRYLAELVKTGEISTENAYLNSHNTKNLEQML